MDVADKDCDEKTPVIAVVNPIQQAKVYQTITAKAAIKAYKMAQSPQKRTDSTKGFFYMKLENEDG